MTSIISPFEYVTVLIAIILGMGLTKIVSGLASLVQNSEKVKVYWPHLILIVLVFILHIQEWWTTYDLINFKWRLPVFLFKILYPVNLYVLARLLFPSSFRTKIIDLKEFYLSNYRRIYLFLIISAVLSLVDNTLIAGIAFRDQTFQFLVLGLFCFVAIKNTKNEIVHKVAALILITASTIALIVTWNIFII